MHLQDINPFIRYASNSSFLPLDDDVYTYDCRLFYMVDGTCSVHVDSKKYNVEKGTVLFWQSGTKYRFSVDSKVKMIVLNFDFTQHHKHITEAISPVFVEEFDQNKVLEHIRFSDCEALNHPLVLENAVFVESDLMQIAEEYTKRKIFFREKSSGLLKKIFIDIARFASATPSNAADKIDMIMEYIRNHYKEKIDGTTLGKLTGYHPYYLNRLMLMYSGTTVHQYLLNYRIECAKKYLTGTDMPITEISSECGFATVSYFSNYFKKKVGMSPLEYRNIRKNLI